MQPRRRGGRLAVTGIMRRRRRATLAAATLVAALLIAGVALALAQSQRDARRTLDQRFSSGSGTAAALVQTIVDQAYANDAAMARRTLASRRLQPAALDAARSRLGASAILIADARGRVVGASPAGAQRGAGPGDHLRQALAGRPAISATLRSGGRDVFEVAVPYRSQAGRRVLLVSTPTSELQQVLAPYLRRIPGIGRQRAYILDHRHGDAREVDSHPTAPPDRALHERLRGGPPTAHGTYAGGARAFSSVAIPHTPWILVRTTSAASLYAPVEGWNKDLPWALLAALVAAGGVLVAMALRAWRSADRARQASEAKSAFLASMSHEIRTPMTTVMGFSEMLVQGRLGELSDEQQEIVGHIHTSSQHLDRLLSEVLDLARVEEGRMHFAPQDVRPHLLVEEVVQGMGGLARDREIALAADAPDVGLHRLDPHRFKQVLYNLIANAVKFTEAGGEVTVRLRRDAAQELALDVIDTGVGIPAEDLDRIFLPFEQGARRNGGAGLGLAISRRIVDAQGGRISVRSQPGQGSTFRVELPPDRDRDPDPDPDPVGHA
jgi:signal transduction histidine kinase